MTDLAAPASIACPRESTSQNRRQSIEHKQRSDPNPPIFSILRTSNTKMMQSSSASVHKTIASGSCEEDKVVVPHKIAVSTEEEEACSHSSSNNTTKDTGSDITTSTSPMNTSTTSTATGSVSFGSIHVREYSRVFSDNWEVSHGLALDWEYLEHAAVEIEPQEEPKVPKDVTTTKKRRSSIHKMFRKLGLKDDKKKSSKKNKPVRVDSFTGQPIGGGRRKSTGNMNSAKGKKTFDKKPLTWQQRANILLRFGYTKEELDRTEARRQQTYFEKILEDY